MTDSNHMSETGNETEFWSMRFTLANGSRHLLYLSGRSKEMLDRKLSGQCPAGNRYFVFLQKQYVGALDLKRLKSLDIQPEPFVRSLQSNVFSGGGLKIWIHGEDTPQEYRVKRDPEDDGKKNCPLAEVIVAFDSEDSYDEIEFFTTDGEKAIFELEDVDMVVIETDFTAMLTTEHLD